MRHKSDKKIIEDLYCFIEVKKAGLDFAYCRGDIEGAKRQKESISNLQDCIDELEKKRRCGDG